MDLYLLVDVVNYSLTYSLCGHENHMSPDDHFQDLKRIISAVGGKARRINVIMPFLYESRQHKRSSRESLDCAIALQELVKMGVDNIITFDAHDPRVQNAIPLHGFETVQPAYQFIKNLLRDQKDQTVSKLAGISHMIDETMLIHQQVGSISETTWSKVSGCPQDIATIQAYAIAKIKGLTEKSARAICREMDQAQQEVSR